MSLMDVKRGDTVVVVYYGWKRGDPHRVSEDVVVSVGPKYITVGRNKGRFHRDSGIEKTEYSPTSAVFVSRAAYDEAVRASQLREKASRLCINFTHHNREASAEQLERIIAALEAVE